MPTISVVSDANVVLKWFHTEGEEEVESACVLLDAHKERTIALSVLDLTGYEVGNALMRGRAGATAEQAATVVEALIEISVAQSHSAQLVTLDRALLDAKLGIRPRELVDAIADAKKH